MKTLFNWLLQKNRLIVVVETIAIIILSFLYQCDGDGNKPETTSDTIRTTDTIRDLRICTTAVKVPVSVHDTIIIPAGEIDSLAVVMAYFTEQEYNIVLADDSDLYAQYNPTVYMNHITGGDFIFQNRRPTAINTTTIIDNTLPERKWHFYLGATVGGSLTSFELAPGFLIQYKRFVCGLNYGIVGKSVNVPLYYELNFKRKLK